MNMFGRPIVRQLVTLALACHAKALATAGLALGLAAFASGAQAEATKADYMLVLDIDAGKAYKGAGRYDPIELPETEIPSAEVAAMGLSWKDYVWTMKDFHFETTALDAVLFTSRTDRVGTLVVKGENSITSGDAQETTTDEAGSNLALKCGVGFYILGDGKLTLNGGKVKNLSMIQGGVMPYVVSGPTLEMFGRAPDEPAENYVTGIFRKGLTLYVTNSTIVIDTGVAIGEGSDTALYANNIVLSGTAKITTKVTKGVSVRTQSQDCQAGARQEGEVLQLDTYSTKYYTYKDAKGNVATNAVLTKPYDTHQDVTSYTEFESGKVYTAPPLTGTKASGGMFYVLSSGILTGKDAVFANNMVSFNGGAITSYGKVMLTNVVFHGNKGGGQGGAIEAYDLLELAHVTFRGNFAAQGSGAIISYGNIYLSGPVTLETETDTISIHKGGLCWMLGNGNEGCLNGFDKLNNKGTLTVRIDDATAFTTVIATGNFSDVSGKDTFVITNVTAGSTATVKIGGDEVVSSDKRDVYRLVTEEDLSVPTTNLLLKVKPPVPILAKPEAVANADAAVCTNGFPSAETEAGSGLWHVWSNRTATVVYTAKQGFFFADGSKTKTVVLDTTVDPAVTKAGEPVPDAPQQPSVQLGLVTQRYPWSGVLDINCSARSIPVPGGSYRIRVTVTLPDGRTASKDSKVQNGQNTAVFDAFEAFGQVRIKGVKVTAEIIELPPL